MADLNRTGDLEVKIVGLDGITSADVTDKNRLKVEPQFHNITLLEDHKVYCVSGQFNMESSGVDNSLLHLYNPSTSAKIFYLLECSAGVEVENNYAIIKLWSNPTISSTGTSQTIVNRNIGISASTSAQAFKFSDTSTNGSQLAEVIYGQNNNSLNVGSLSVAIQPGNGILLTGNPKSNNRELALTLVWIEE